MPGLGLSVEAGFGLQIVRGCPIFASGDLMSEHGLLGAAEADVRPGLQATHQIPSKPKGGARPRVRA